jgi:ABC-2 type transport system ATP-binding protein
VSIIRADRLSKTFVRRQRLIGGAVTRVEAVRDLSFQVEQGGFIGFLGPNGAGKSTTVKMLSGILEPSAGSAEVDGLRPGRDRVRLACRMGVVFGQRTQLWWDLPLIESYRILRAMYRVPAADFRARLAELEGLFELAAFLSTPVRQLSLGQRMRAELTAALLHRPSVLFLDEPTIGLDVTAKAVVRDRLAQLNREEGTTILLTTHDMGDVEALCDRILIISHGTLVFDGRPDQLTGEVGAPRALRVTFRAEPDRALLSGLAPVTVIPEGTRTLLLEFDGRAMSAAAVLEWARRAGEFEDFSLQEPRLEDVMRGFYHRDLAGEDPSPAL